MKTRKTSLLLATTSAAALSVFAFGTMGSTTADAACASVPPGTPLANGGVVGTNGVDDVITCVIFGAQGGDVLALGGDDTITVTFATQGLIDGGTGNDVISLGLAAADEVRGDAGDDTITIAASAVTGAGVFGEAGNDTINITALSVVTAVSGGAGDDDINFDGLLYGTIDGDGGDDLINLNTGGGGNVDAGGDDDTVNLNGSIVAGFVTGSAGNDVLNIKAGGAVAVLGGGDDDVITQTGGLVGVINGESGEDTINLEGGAAGFVGGGSDNDLIRLNGAALTGILISGQSGDDEIQLLSGTAGVVEGGSGEDTIELTDATVLAIVGDDFGDGVDGPGENDVILLNGGTVAAFKGIGGDVWGQGGEDIIILDGTSVANNIRGGLGNDTIAVFSGTASIVQGDADEDFIIMSGGSVFAITGDSFDDTVDGKGDDDVIILEDGTIGLDVWGQGGNDFIVLNGALVTNDIQGGNDDDTVILSDGTVTNVWGDSATPAGDGDDVILLTGLLGGPGTAEVLNDINGGAGDDFIGLTDGTVGGDVFGSSGNDIIGLAGANVGGNIAGGDDDDLIVVLDGTVGGSIFGQDQNDAILLFGGTVGVDVNSGTGNDIVVQAGANIVGDLTGFSENDLVVLFDGTIGGAALGGSEDDIGVVTGPFDFDNLGAGAGNFAGDDNTDTDDGIDTLFFFDWTGDVNADRLPEWNEVNIVNDSAVTFTGGTLETDGGGDIEVLIDASSALLLNDSGPGGSDLTILGNLTNEGLIDMSSADSDPDNVLTVTGDYTATGDLVIDTFLDDGKSVPDNTDLLSIGGNAGGQTDLTVNPVFGSPGGLTGTGATDGILVVEAATSNDDAFSLTNADLVAGIFEYELVNPDGQPVGQDNWYLQSDFLDQIYVYESLPGALQTIGSSLIGQRVERVGVRSAVPTTVMDADGNPVAGGLPVDTALWARAVGVSVESEGDLDSTTGANFDQTVGFIQGGGEIVVSQGASGRLLIGALGHWGTSSLDVNGADNVARGSADVDFYGGGLTATWYGTGGLYVDGVVQYTAYDVDISTATRWSSTSTDGYGIAASGEVGYRIPISATAALVPQAQVVWQTIDFDDFTDPDGVTVSLNDGDSLVGRLGVAFENSAAIGSSLVTGYVEANLLHEFLGDNEISASTFAGGPIPISQDLGGTSVEVGFGGTIAVNSGVSLYGEIDYTIPFDNGVQGFQALAGVRVNLNPVAPPPPAPVLVPVAETGFIVFFDWDRADLTPEANLVLDDVVVTANQGGYASVRLDGYTDLSGSAAYNLGLSERRANSVADGLIARGIAPDEIVIRAFGEENPLVPTPDGVREPQNRRVEIFLS